MIIRQFSSKAFSFPLAEAVRSCRALASANFDSSIDIVMNTFLDPRRQDQMLRGTCILPHGTGKTLRVAVFAQGELAEQAKEAGADIVGSDSLIESIEQGQIDFDKVIATPDMMPIVAKVARLLGPRGLMPNPKLGSVTKDVKTAIEAAQGGQINFKTEKQGIIHACIGRASFTNEQLIENIETLVEAIHEHKPSGAKKNKFFKSSFISSTHSKSLRLDINETPFKQ